MESPQPSASRLLLTACIISLVCFLGSHMRIPIVPLFAASLGADTVQVGLINSSFMLMAGALSIPAGLISDRIGRRLPILAGLFLLAGSSFLLYWSNSPLQMGVIYLFFGVGLAALSPTLMSYVADITPSEALGQAFGWYTMALYGGMTLGPAFGGLLGTSLGLRPVFLLSGALILLMFLVAFFFLPEPPAHPRDAGSSPAIGLVLPNLMGNKRLIACLLATIGGCVAFGMFVSFMPLYIRSLGMNTAAVGFVFATQALVNALSRLPSGWLCDHVPDRTLLVLIGFSILALAQVIFGFCRSVPSLMATAAMMGIGMGTAFTIIYTLITDSVPKKMRGLAMGCYNTSVYIGMMLSSACVGFIIREYGFRVGFCFSGAAVTVMLFLFRWLHPRGGAGK